MCRKMSSAPASSSLGVRIGKVLELLDVISCNAPRKVTQQLAQDAREIVEEISVLFENTPFRQLVQMVKFSKWDFANEILNNHFPTADIKSDAIKQVLTLVYNEGRQVFDCNTHKWVKNLHGELQPVACEAMYELSKMEPYNDHELLLLHLL